MPAGKEPGIALLFLTQPVPCQLRLPSQSLELQHCASDQMLVDGPRDEIHSGQLSVFHHVQPTTMANSVCTAFCRYSSGSSASWCSRLILGQSQQCPICSVLTADPLWSLIDQSASARVCAAVLGDATIAAGVLGRGTSPSNLPSRLTEDRLRGLPGPGSATTLSVHWAGGQVVIGRTEGG